MTTLGSRSTDDEGLTSVSSRRRGVLLINLGTPAEPTVASVRRYLSEFLSDPAVIRMPTGLGLLNGVVGRIIAYLRAPVSTQMYRKIWTERGSPLKGITDDQVIALQAALPPGWSVFSAMRYGRPSIAETLHKIEASGISELVIVPMYPQYSGPTTGTALRQVYGYLRSAGHQLHVTTRSVWYDDHGYIKAQAALIASYAKSAGLTPQNSYLLFSTHGLPTSYVRRGDPYPRHVARTVALVGDRLGWPADRMSLAYQSRFGPVEWLRPYTDKVMLDLVHTGEKQLMICPVSFTTDCLETLEEIDLRYRDAIEAAGAELFLCPALDTFAPFISALKHLVLQGPTPMTRAVPSIRSFEPVASEETTADDHVSSLVMVGVSTAGRISNPRGPKIEHVDADTLRKIKRSQCEVPPLLRRVRSDAGLREAFLWNTCHRFELYGWRDKTSPAMSEKERIAAIRKNLFDAGAPADLRVNVLSGVEAWHHLLRTAVGLNSDLPAERDVLEQLHAAHRLASRAGTVGPRMTRNLTDVCALDRKVRDESEWGALDADYCAAALSRITASEHLDLRPCRIVVIGGSTTSASALRALRTRFDVPAGQLTLLYRGHKHGGQIKMLRKAVGGGRRIRVQSYDEEQVLRSVAEADVLVFGVDRAEPVLTAERVRGVRDWEARPLTIFDFNMVGSTAGLRDVSGITVYDAKRLQAEVEHFADEICNRSDFAETVNVVETAVTGFVSRFAGELQGDGSTATCPKSVARVSVSLRSAPARIPAETEAEIHKP